MIASNANVDNVGVIMQSNLRSPSHMANNQFMVGISSREDLTIAR